MSVDRRKFLKLAGLTTIIGASGKASLDALASDFSGHEDQGSTETDKRLAMVIDLRRWTEADSERCQRACHEAHNVPDFLDPKDQIKWFWKEPFVHAFPSQEDGMLPRRYEDLEVPLLCNHCDNPPCTRVCPTQATWKRDSDGIVMMDWHRCIGCRYCVAACPYGSRSFNWRDPRTEDDEHLVGGRSIDEGYPTRQRGVVEKCTFCEERLSHHDKSGKPDPLPPACVEAASGKILFGDLNGESRDDIELKQALGNNFTIRRKPGLGTRPEVYYIV